MDDIRDSFSKLNKRIKRGLKGSKRKPDKTGADARGERVDPTGVAGSGRGGNETGADARQARPTDRAPQQESMSAGGSDDDQRGGEADIYGSEVTQRYSHLDPDVEVAITVGGRRSGEVERVYPPPSISSIPYDGEPDNNADTSAVPDPAPEVLHPEKSVGPSAAANENMLDWKSIASATAKLLLRGVRDSADAFGPLKSVAGGLCFILENRERTSANEKAIESLAPRVKAFAELLCAPVSEGDVKERERRKKLERKLQDVRRDLAPLEGQGKVAGFFNNLENAGKLGGLVEDIRDAMIEYQTSLQQDLYDRSFLLIESADLALLDRMYHTPDAGYRCGDRHGCLRGTRKDVLWEIEQWLIAERGQRVFWLNGLAGTGKSTIAQTFAETSFADGKLGASFFCSRDFTDQSNLRAIFPTLAFQLAYQYPRFRKELLQVLKARPDVGHESLCSQMEKLIVGPLKAAHISTLIIIDALDECKDKEPASAILSTLSRYMDEIPEVKFFITGRPEPRIRSGFRLAPLRPITEVLRLHDVEPSSVDNDIKLFFRTRLTDIAKTRSDCDFTEDWPNSSDINILCEKAAGFFIYASTVVKLFTSRNRTLTEQLDRIISFPQSTVHEGRSGIDLLYAQVLEQAVDDTDTDAEEIYSRFRTVVGAALLAFNPLPVKALSDLLRVSSISTTLHSLHSLLLIPDPKTEDPIRPFHKSFPDFLTDPKRCGDKWFFVKPTVYHTEILLSCLNFMRERLKKNICNLDDYAILSEVKDLSTRRKDYIGGALEYASCFWTKHLLEIPGSSPHVGEVQKAIDGFFMMHLLDWMEILVLTGNLGIGVYAMNDVEQWYTSTGVLCKWTDDSQRFLLEHFDTIYNSPSHIYHSALPFCPSSSWLQEFYSAELSLQAKVVKGLPAEWGKCSRTVLFNDEPQALSYLNNTIAVGYVSNGNITILNAITGRQAALLTGHTSYARSLTFSSDGTSLVSGGDDRTVKLWDIQTGGVVKTFAGHTNWVFSVSISADCTRIASGSSDNTVRLWNIQTGECYCVITQQSTVYHVRFIPTDPQHLLSISNNKVCKWDANGHQTSQVCDGSHLNFSLDGTQFALCNGAVVTVQNSDSRAIVTKFHTTNSDTSHCCFSPDGKLVAVAAGFTVYVWKITGPDPCLVGTFIDHTYTITSLVFSSPTCLISASRDKSIKFWQIGASPTAPAGTDPKSTSLNSAPIKSFTLQAKDGITISSDSDGVVRTWDISTGTCKSIFQTPAKDPYHRDVRLIDDRLIVIWHTDRKIYIWDAEKGELLQTVDAPGDVDAPENEPHDLRISGDGTKVFCLYQGSIQAWSIWTGENVGIVRIGTLSPKRSLTVDDSKAWIHYPQTEYQGWDFGIPGLSPVELSSISTLHLSGPMVWDIIEFRIKDTVSGKIVFHLPERFVNPIDVQCDGCYLAARYSSGDILILDFNHVFPQL